MKALSEFSSTEIERASRLSPAVAAYIRHVTVQSQTALDTIRILRHKAWLEATLNTLFNTASTEEICRDWSRQTDRIVSLAWREAGLDDLPLALFALGKWGSEELNLSSDIDLIVVSKLATDEKAEAKIRKFKNLLNEATALGFAFRVDFDLRPGGTSTPLITSIDRFEYHYWSQGEPWERLALTRLRWVCGNKKLGEETCDLARRFSYRKFIDINLLEDLKSLRQKIHQNLRVRDPRPESNIKLGIGGIRDIELFLQSLMVIHGGRATPLQQHHTTAIAESLKNLKILPPSEADFLIEAYWFLRDIENRIQLVRDTQTHSLPPRPLSEEIISPPTYSRLEQVQKRVDDIVSSLLGQVDLTTPQLPAGLEEQKIWLEQLGFSLNSRDQLWPKLIENTSLGLKTRNSELVRKEFLYRFVTVLNEINHDRDLGLSFLLDFIKATRAKSSFYSLLIREDRLLRDLALLFSISPYLSQILCSRPDLVDSLLLKSQEPFSEDFDSMLDDMAENKLLSEFICALEFFRSHNLTNLFENLTRTADNICRHLLEKLKDQFFRESTLNILCLGKWGGQDLGLRSDLDFIFVTDNSPSENDFKIAKRFISRLQDPHRGGRLYGIDLRLRPSGNAGPLILTKERLSEFLMESAEPWQRQSYLRARYLNAGVWDFHTVINKSLSKEDFTELRRIREKLTYPLDSSSTINIKYSRGGLIDTELCVQTLLLHYKIIPTSTRTDLQIGDLNHSSLNTESLENIRQNYLRLRTAEQMIKLIQQSDSLLLPAQEQHREKLAKILQTDSTDVESYLRQVLQENETFLKELDPIWSE